MGAGGGTGEGLWKTFGQRDRVTLNLTLWGLGFPLGDTLGYPPESPTGDPPCIPRGLPGGYPRRYPEDTPGDTSRDTWGYNGGYRGGCGDPWGYPRGYPGGHIGVYPIMINSGGGFGPPLGYSLGYPLGSTITATPWGCHPWNPLVSRGARKSIVFPTGNCNLLIQGLADMVMAV